MKKEEWEKLLGGRLLRELCRHIPEVKSYLEGQPAGGPGRRKGGVLERARQADRALPEKLRQFMNGYRAEKEDGYIQLYVPFLTLGCKELHDHISGLPVYKECIYRCFAESLLSELETLSIRILIHELRNAQLDGTAYEAFLHRLGSEGYREELLERYSALEKIFTQCIDGRVNLFSEVIFRFSQDKSKIQDQIFGGESLGKIDRIETGLSDPHCLGRQVLKIRTEDGKSVIYKPHSLENEQWFHQFVSSLGARCQLDMYVPRQLSYKEYGWSEVIAHKPCETEREVKRYFQRMGLYVLAAYILGTNDIHCENLIAMGEYPVIIDLESLSAIQAKTQSPNADFMHLQLKDSVLASGILPYYYWTEGAEGIDLSAMSGGDNSRVKFKVPVIKGWGTEQIHVAYEQPEIPQKLNRPVLDGHFMLPGGYEKEILAGFEAGYRYVMGCPEEIKEKLRETENFMSRHLAADTQKYSMLLRSSCHPDVMGAEADRKLLLHFLWKNRDFASAFDRSIVNAEIKDLLNLNIPYFYFYMGRRDLYDSEGNRIPGYFAYSGEEQILRRLEKLCARDLAFQKRLIHISLNGYRKEDLSSKEGLKELRKMIENPSAYREKEIRKAAECIGDKLLREAVYDQERNEALWIVFDVFKEKSGAVHIVPCSMYLYNGISGMLLFFYLLSQRSGRKEFSEMFRVLEKQLYDYTCRLRKEEKVMTGLCSGLYNGEASIVYTYLILFWYSKEERYLTYAREHAEILERTAEADEKADLLEGRAGAVLAFCLLYQIKAEEKYLSKAEKIADLLIDSAVKVGNGIGWSYEQGDVPLLGMAHGNAGIMTALLQLFKLTHREKYYVCFQKAYVYEYENYNPSTGDWKDFRGNKLDEGLPSAWCHGSGGILLSRLLMCGMDLAEPEMEKCREEIKKAAGYFDRHKSRADLCLCHGECGNSLIARKFLEECGENTQELENMTEFEPQEVTILGKEWGNPGLMNGMAGIGYYLLVQSEGAEEYILDLPFNLCGR